MRDSAASWYRLVRLRDVMMLPVILLAPTLTGKALGNSAFEATQIGQIDSLCNAKGATVHISPKTAIDWSELRIYWETYL